jgi:uncharacterized protein (TIGR02001 family)
MAQVSFSASIASDYRYRGISLSDQSPSPQLGVNYDSSAGAYAGLSLAKARFRYTGAKAQAIAYAGWAQRLGANLSWDAGASATSFRGAEKYNYQEWYAGLNGARSGVRLSLSPRYFGVGGKTAYLEFNGSHALTPDWDLVAHAGYLHALGNAERWRYPTKARFDGRLGVATELEGWAVQLAYTATRENAALYQGGVGSSARRVVLSTSRGF